MNLEEMKSLPEKEQKRLFNRLKTTRQKSKIVNFSALYRVGAEALARNSNMSLKDAKKLLRVYWERNKAVKQFEETLIVKEIGARKWIQNPVSGFWHVLRSEKDKFATINSSTATYCFDVWLTHVRNGGIRVPMQIHDEWNSNIPLGHEDEAKEIVEDAMDKVNNKLKLNVQLGCDIQFGLKYSLIH